MFGLLQPEHLVVILIIVLIVFGAGKLPDTMRDLGRGVRTFREEAARNESLPAPVPAPVPASVATSTCPACGKPTAANAKFCTECGKAL